MSDTGTNLNKDVFKSTFLRVKMNAAWKNFCEAQLTPPAMSWEDYCRAITEPRAVPSAERAMQAICARLRGEYDDPALMSYGPLSASVLGDICYIANSYSQQK